MPNPKCLILKEQISKLKEVKQTLAEKNQNMETPEDMEEVKQLRKQAEKLLQELKETIESLNTFFNLKNFHQNTKPFMLESFTGAGNNNFWNFDQEKLAEATKNIENPEIIQNPTEYYKKLSEIAIEQADQNNNRGHIIQLEQQIEYDLEKMKIETVNPKNAKKFPEMQDFFKQNPNPKVHEVFSELHKQYPKKIPAGLDFYTKILKLVETDQAKAEQLLDVPQGEWRLFFCPGTSVIDSDRRAVSPGVRWSGDDFRRGRDVLRGGWDDDCRVVFLGI